MSKRAALAFAAGLILVAPASASPTRTIASARVQHFRIFVTAVKTSGGAAPSARVSIAAFQRSPGGWRSLGRVQLRGTFFWKVLTGTHSVRNLSVSNAPPRASVQLLITPSIGWSPLYRVHVAGGRLVRG